MSATATIERPKDRTDEYRVRVGRVRLLSIPDHRFVMVEGAGAPNEGSFGPRLPGLYSMAYGLHFALKRRGITGKVGPLEGLWWTADEATDLEQILKPDRTTWRWILMIVLPEATTDAELAEQFEAARAKLDPAIAATLSIERYAEGDVAQVMHVGPYSQEQASIERLHAGIAEAGYRPRGRHHELYLGDPRRAAPEKLRTVLRQPIQR